MIDEEEESVEEETEEDFEEVVEEVEDEEEEVEEEFDDEALREELEKIDDKEIEERIDKEHKKNIEEEIEENDNEELKELLSEMKDTNEVDPEEVVRNFEEEQEAQSIISYQELVNAVKKRDTEYVDELETKPLATVSDFIKADKKTDVVPETNVLDMIEKLEKKPEPVKEEVEEQIETLEKPSEKIETLEVLEEEIEELELPKKKEEVIEIPDEGKFKKTDLISPVFGRMKEKTEIDYPKVEKFDRSANKAKDKTTKKVETLVPTKKVESSTVNKKQESNDIDEILLQTVLPDFGHMDISKKSEKEVKSTSVEEELKNVNAMFEDLSDSIVEKEKKKAVKEKVEDEEIESLSAISKNEDFLKALRDFRDSL